VDDRIGPRVHPGLASTSGCRRQPEAHRERPCLRLAWDAGRSCHQPWRPSFSLDVRSQASQLNVRCRGGGDLADQTPAAHGCWRLPGDLRAQLMLEASCRRQWAAHRQSPCSPMTADSTGRVRRASDALVEPARDFAPPSLESQREDWLRATPRPKLHICEGETDGVSSRGILVRGWDCSDGQVRLPSEPEA
jgi:hypothetical protein